MQRAYVVGMAVVVAVCLFTGIGYAQNMLENPGFEDGVAEDTGLPLSWPTLLGESKWDSDVLFTSQAHSGKHAILISDKNNKLSYGLRSKPVPIVPGRTYKA